MTPKQRNKFEGLVFMCLGTALCTNHNWVAIIGVIFILRAAWRYTK